MFNTLISYLHRALPNMWQQRGIMARCLLPLSWLYEKIALRRKQRQLAQSQPPLPVPILVIGNVIAGGAGKTPVCIAVVQYFQRMGIPVGVISRGYGRNATDCVVLDTHNCHTIHADQTGDEPLLIHQHTDATVAVCAQRYTAAKALLAHAPHTQLLVCDDGLQHWALPRDGEICVFDGRGIGNGWLLPAGPLRETWFRNCTFYIQTQAWHSAAVAPTFPTHAVVHQAQRSLAQQNIIQWVHNQQRIHAIAGIARPQVFFSMLRAAGLMLGETHALPDHANAQQLAHAIHNLPDDGCPIVCTEKDMVKLSAVISKNPRIYSIGLTLTCDAAFFEALDAWWQKLAATKISA